MGNMLAIFLLSMINFALPWDIQMGGRYARFDRFDGTCEGSPDVKIIFDYKGIRSKGQKLFMNCTITVKEDVDAPPKLELNLKRCKVRENLDTCEEFHTLKTDGYCKMIESNSTLWGPFFSSIKPPWKCPLKKGTYKSIDSEFDMSAFLLFPTDGWFWKVKGTMYDGETNEIIMCAYIEAHMLVNPKRKRFP